MDYILDSGKLNKYLLSAGPPIVFTFFYFVVPEKFKN
jgi:hypothetical protein